MRRLANGEVAGLEVGTPGDEEEVDGVVHLGALAGPGVGGIYWVGRA